MKEHSTLGVAVIPGASAVGKPQPLSEYSTATLVEDMPVAVLAVDAAGFCHFANPAACQLLGYRRSRLQQLALIELAPEIGSDDWTERFVTGRDTGTVCFSAVFRSAERRSLRLNLYGTGIESSIWFVLVDQTAPSERLDELEKRDRQLRAFFTNSSTDINLKDKHGRYIMVSRQFEEHFGLPAGTAEGKLPQDMFPPAFADHVREHDLKVMATRELTTQEDIVPVEHGDKTLLVSKFPIVHPDGELEGIGVIATDISYLKEIEDALRASEERFKDFARAAADFFWEVDAELGVTYLSEGFEALTGLDPNDCCGKPISTLLQHAVPDQQDLNAHLHDLLSRVPFSDMTYQFRLNDGSVRIVRNSGKPLFDEHGQFRGYRGAAADKTEAHVLSRKLSFQATHDHLTGLLNRRGFEQALHNAFGYDLRVGQTHTLCYMDLDQFKLVNDTCGHTAGDALLRQVAELIGETLRNADSVARLGGDEFGLLLIDCELDAAVDIACKLRNRIRQQSFVWASRRFRLGASIGLAARRSGESSPTSEQLLSYADAACYVAKEEGRNRVHAYHPGDERLAARHREMEWVSEIQHALGDQRFSLLTQPILAADGGSDGIRRVEVLLRLTDRSGRLISPGQFMTAAERYGEILRIDRWVVSEVAERLSRLHHDSGDWQISVNLSGLSLGDEGFLEFLVERLAAASVDPQSLCFEITETVAIAHIDKARHFVQTIKAMGSSFALDDFGSGMSSFRYLKSLPVDYLKIDGQFVAELHDDPSDRAFIEAMVHMARSLGIKTVAEHVEHHEVGAILHDIGVDYLQGFGIGEPTLWNSDAWPPGVDRLATDLGNRQSKDILS